MRSTRGNPVRAGSVSRAVAVIGALALSAGACGSSTSSSAKTPLPTTSGNVPTSSGHAAPAKSLIVIGMPVAATGYSSTAQAPTFAVAAAWQKWVNNDLGGINGHPVKVVTIDTKADPATALTASRELIDQDK